MRATCRCTSTLLIVAGEVVCATCRAPVVDDVTASLPAEYGSRLPWSPPPKRSHRWLRDHGPELLGYGAHRKGGKRGRDVVWIIPREGYERWLADQRRPAPNPAPAMTNLVRVDPASWIKASGHRMTRTA